MIRTLLAALALAALLPAAASAAVLEQADATELAQSLAEATEAQDVCYGWRVAVRDPSGAEDGLDVGSSLGPGRDVEPARPECRRYAVLVADVIYTSEFEEAEDSASWSIDANLGKPPTVRELDALGYSADDLLGDDNDLAIINATGALPQLVADHGEAPPVPFETSARPPGVSGEATGSPGSDFLRQNGPLVALCAILVLAGLFLVLRDVSRRRRPPSSLSQPPT